MSEKSKIEMSELEDQEDGKSNYETFVKENKEQNGFKVEDSLTIKNHYKS